MILGGVVRVFHNHRLIPAGERGADNGGMALVQMQRLSVQDRAANLKFSE